MFTDTHAHIYAEEFDDDRQEIIEQCLNSGVGKIYMPNVDERSIDRMLETEEKNKDICVSTMGLHPCSVGKNFEKKLYVIEEWLEKRKFAAVGEIGTDLYHDKTFFEQQKEAFKIQVQWAVKYKLPVVIHCRNSIRETIDELKSMESIPCGIFHCFSGSLDEAKEIIELGFYLGIGGVLTFKNGGLDKILPDVPVEKIVLETDSPYLAPVPYRGKRNSPNYIPLIAEKLANLKEMPIGEIAQITTANSRNIFAEV